MTSGSTSFSSLDGIESNINVVDLADLTSLYNSSSPLDFGSKIVHKVITAVLLGNANTC